MNQNNNEEMLAKILNIAKDKAKTLKCQHLMLEHILYAMLKTPQIIKILKRYSIDCDAIYHHLTDFGTNSILITIGKIKKEVVIIDGKEQIRDIVEFGAAVDERIGDGYYFVKSMKLLQKILDSPELLEADANEKIEETNK